MDATVARFANAARAYADEAPPPRPRPQLTAGFPDNPSTSLAR
jgi:hypothetical protein